MPSWEEIVTLWSALRSNVLGFWGGILGLLFTAIWIFWEKAPMTRVFLVFFISIFFLSLVLVWLDEYRDHKNDQALYQKSRKAWETAIKTLQTKPIEQPRVVYRDKSTLPISQSPKSAEAAKPQEQKPQATLTIKAPQVATTLPASPTKLSSESLRRRQKVLDEYADKINGSVLVAFRHGRKIWDDWNTDKNPISSQQCVDRLADFKKETIAAFEQIDELWRKYHFDYPDITGSGQEWTNSPVAGKAEAFSRELVRVSKLPLDESNKRSAMDSRIVEEYYSAVNDLDQWINAKRKLIADKRKEYEAAAIGESR
jgi:hypothetical protein